MKVPGQMKVTVEGIGEGSARLRMSIADDKGVDLMTWPVMEVPVGAALAMSEVLLTLGSPEPHDLFRWHIVVDPDQTEAKLSGHSLGGLK